MFKKLFTIFCVSFIFLYCSPVYAINEPEPTITSRYFNGELVAFSFPISAHSGGDWVQYKWRTKKVYFDIYDKNDNILVKVEFTTQEIRNMPETHTISGDIFTNDYEAIASITLKSITDKLSTDVLRILKTNGGKIGSSSDIAIAKINRNWDTGKEVNWPGTNSPDKEIFHSYEVIPLFSRLYDIKNDSSSTDKGYASWRGQDYKIGSIKFTDTAITDIKKRFPLGKVDFPLGDLSLDTITASDVANNYIQVNDLKYNKEYSLNVNLKNTFWIEFENHDINVKVTGVQGNKVVQEILNDIITIPKIAAATEKEDYYAVFPAWFKVEQITFTVPNTKDINKIRVEMTLDTAKDESGKIIEDNIDNNKVTREFTITGPPEQVLPAPNDLSLSNLKLNGNNVTTGDDLKLNRGETATVVYDVNNGYKGTKTNNLTYQITSLDEFQQPITGEGDITNEYYPNLSIPKGTSQFATELGLPQSQFIIPTDENVKFVKIYAKLDVLADEENKGNNVIDGRDEGIILRISKDGDLSLDSITARNESNTLVTEVIKGKTYTFEVNLKNRFKEEILNHGFNVKVIGMNNAMEVEKFIDKNITIPKIEYLEVGDYYRVFPNSFTGVDKIQITVPTQDNFNRIKVEMRINKLNGEFDYTTLPIESTNNYVSRVFEIVPPNDLLLDNTVFYNSSNKKVNEYGPGEVGKVTFNAKNIGKYNAGNRQIHYEIKALKADKSVIKTLVNTTITKDILAYSNTVVPTGFGAGDIKFTVPSNAMYIGLYATIQEHPLGEENTENNKLDSMANGYIIRVKHPNLNAIRYFGEDKVKTGQKFDAGIVVNSTFSNICNDVPFKYEWISASGSVVKTDSSKSQDITSGQKNYNDGITAPTSEGFYTLKITVNPNGNNPPEVNTSDNYVEQPIVVSKPYAQTDIAIISYEGAREVSTLQDTFPVRVKVSSDYGDHLDDFVVEFNGATYNTSNTPVLSKNILNGTHEYMLLNLTRPNISGNEQNFTLKIIVNADNNPVEPAANRGNNTYTTNIRVFTPDVPPPEKPPTFTMELDLNPDPNISSNEIWVKSGYGIPVELNIASFTHYIDPATNPSIYDCINNPGGTTISGSTVIRIADGTGGRGKEHSNFIIDPLSTATLNSNTSNGFSFARKPDGNYNLTTTQFEVVAGTISGESATLRLTPENVNGTQRYLIYTDPNLPDGDYKILVDATVSATWKERIEWWNPHKTFTLNDPGHIHYDRCSTYGYNLCGHKGHGNYMSWSCGAGSWWIDHDYDSCGKNCVDSNKDGIGDYCSGHHDPSDCVDYYSCNHSHSHSKCCSNPHHIPNTTQGCSEGASSCNLTGPGKHPNNISHVSGCYTWQGGWESKLVDQNTNNYVYKTDFVHQQLEGIIHIRSDMYSDDGIIIND